MRLLEVIGYDFQSEHAMKYIIKIGKKMEIKKEIVKYAWILAENT